MGERQHPTTDDLIFGNKTSETVEATTAVPDSGLPDTTWGAEASTSATDHATADRPAATERGDTPGARPGRGVHKA